MHAGLVLSGRHPPATARGSSTRSFDEPSFASDRIADPKFVGQVAIRYSSSHSLIH